MSAIEQWSSEEVEREALFFAVLRERVRPVASELSTVERALAVVTALQGELGGLQEQLGRLVEGAMALMPRLDAAALALEAAPEATAALDPPPSLSAKRRFLRMIGTKIG